MHKMPNICISKQFEIVWLKKHHFGLKNCQSHKPKSLFIQTVENPKHALETMYDRVGNFICLFLLLISKLTPKSVLSVFVLSLQCLVRMKLVLII